MKYGTTIATLSLLFTLFASGDEIHDAINNNDLARVKQIVEQDSSVLLSSFGDQKMMPLHLAVSNNNLDIVAFLLTQGADINGQDSWYESPLYHATKPKMARLLIKNGADLNPKRHATGAIAEAVIIDNLALMKVFSEYHKRLNFTSVVELGLTDVAAERLKQKPWLAKTPKILHTACANGNLEVVRLLLNHGADPNQNYGFMNVSGPSTPLSSAVSHGRGHYDVAKLLCQFGAETDVASGLEHNLIHKVVRDGELRMLQLLLDNGANVHSTRPMLSQPNAMTPLHVACLFGGVDKAKLLIERGADVDATTREGYSTLFLAAASHHEDVARLLLENGAKPDIYLACRFGRIEIVERLLKSNPELVHSPDPFRGETPLFWAIRGNSVATARRIIEAGADVKSRSQSIGKFKFELFHGELKFWSRWKTKGPTPLDLAKKIKNSEIVQLLAEKTRDAEDD